MTKKRPGRPAKLGDHQPYLLRLPSSLHRQIRRHAKEHGCSMNDLLVAVIQYWAEGKMEATDQRREAGIAGPSSSEGARSRTATTKSEPRS